MIELFKKYLMVKKLETTASTYSAYLRGTIFPLQKHFLKGK